MIIGAAASYLVVEGSLSSPRLAATRHGHVQENVTAGDDHITSIDYSTVLLVVSDTLLNHMTCTDVAQPI